MNSKFVAAHQQAGDFDVVIQDGKIVQKNGGNVASYFCTPEGRVVNAVLGPVEAGELLREANWSLDIYDTIRAAEPADAREQLADAHDAARQGRGGRSQQVHRLLATKPLVGLDEIYQRLFNELGEGERAKRLQSPEVLAVQDDNEQLRAEKRRLEQRLNGKGSAKEQALKDENVRLGDQVQQLREIDKQRTKAETDAFGWLQTARTYLATGKKEDVATAKARLRIILDRYPETKAAEKAAAMLESLRKPSP
jgi:hypothetical protein